MAISNTTSMTKEQLIAQLEVLQKANSAMAGGLIVKKTDKGGIYIKDNSFIEFSQNRLDKLIAAEDEKFDKAVAAGKTYTKKVLTHKDGNYTACINVTPNAARELFMNEERLASVIAQVKEVL